MPAQPLTPADIAEIKAEGFGDLLVEIDGGTFSRDDVWTCQGCGTHLLDAMHLNDDGFCDTCDREGGAEREAEEIERRIFWRSVL